MSKSGSTNYKEFCSRSCLCLHSAKDAQGPPAGGLGGAGGGGSLDDAAPAATDAAPGAADGTGNDSILTCSSKQSRSPKLENAGRPNQILLVTAVRNTHTIGTAPYSLLL